jgi:FkbH-like protein
MQDTKEILNSYLEGDAALRASQFEGFLSALATVKSGDGLAAAAAYAQRAVSPMLDYTSLTRLGKYLPARAAEHRLRVAVLGGPTTIQLVRLLEMFLLSQGIEVEIYQCEYGLFRQELLTPRSGLDTFQPQVVFLAVDARDVSHLPSVTTNAKELSDLFESELQSWTNLWNTARSKWNSIIIQNTFVAPDYPALGHFACRRASAKETYLNLLNQRIAENVPAHVVLHDLRLLAADVGYREWFDPRFYFEAKLPCAPECLVAYAHSVATLVSAVRGKNRKVLVLDLDNTLWGGIVGEVGIEGITLGQGSGEGEAFLTFQEYTKSLYERGVLLAVCSKNDEPRAREPFEKRRDMVLRLEHIACFVANWNDKPQNLRNIARALNVGLDSLVFVDDDPVERALMRRCIPEVAVPDMPEDPSGYLRAVSLHKYFETISFTAEDAQRTQYCKQDAERAAMAAQVTDVEEFLKSLDMVATIESVNPLNIPRVTQLLNKSNQFNLTTRRYTQAEIEQIAANKEWSSLAISLRDRCGDNGLISVLLLRQLSQSLVVDTWLMSCRVLQRGVETLALRQIVKVAKERGATAVEGCYIPTEKNGMVREHYSRLGFKPTGSDGTKTLWRLGLAEISSLPPCHIREEYVL